jgi:hypothetical protein
VVFVRRYEYVLDFIGLLVTSNVLFCEQTKIDT